MRRNFAQCIREAELSPLKEYQKLYDMLFEPTFKQENGAKLSIHDVLGQHFKYMWFHGTCFSLDEFDQQSGFEFSRDPDNFSVNHICCICEYLWNMLMGYDSALASQGYGYGIFANRIIDINYCQLHIREVMEKLGYTLADEYGFTIFVPKNAVADSVAGAKAVPSEVGKKIISYNHYSMNGDIQEKKTTLLQLADLLEPKRKDLDKADKVFSSDLFYLFNNLNLRHNNIDPASKGKYKKAVAEMSATELEHWYDETYQMCLLAFMQLEQAERKAKFDELKKQIETT